MPLLQLAHRLPAPQLALWSQRSAPSIEDVRFAVGTAHQQSNRKTNPLLDPEDTMRSTLRTATRLLLTLAVVGATACGGGDDATAPSPGPQPGPAPSGNVSGSYSLTQVRTKGNLGGGGSGLPVTFVDGSGDQLVFSSGTLMLGSDGTFDMKVQVTFKGSSAELTDYGTYSAAGGSIDFASQKATPRLSTATLSGNKITANSQFGGIPFEIELER
jgi:hypothetical protein